MIGNGFKDVVTTDIVKFTESRIFIAKAIGILVGVEQLDVVIYDLPSKQDYINQIPACAKNVVSLVLPSEIERIALKHPLIKNVKAKGIKNPITGQHIEIVCEPQKKISVGILKRKLRNHFNLNLDPAIRPLKIIVKEVKISHRFKKQ